MGRKAVPLLWSSVVTQVVGFGEAVSWFGVLQANELCFQKILHTILCVLNAGMSCKITIGDL